jgi:hypothetical protein
MLPQGLTEAVALLGMAARWLRKQKNPSPFRRGVMPGHRSIAGGEAMLMEAGDSR